MILLGEKKGSLDQDVFSWMLVEFQAPASLERTSSTFVGIGFNILNSR